MTTLNLVPVISERYTIECKTIAASNKLVKVLTQVLNKFQATNPDASLDLNIKFGKDCTELVLTICTSSQYMLPFIQALKHTGVQLQEAKDAPGH